MNINKLLKGLDCKCSKHHSCSIEYVYIEKNAINRLSDICSAYNSVLVVADENTFNAAGEKTLNVLVDKKINKVIFDGKAVLVPDEKAINTVMAALCDAEVIIAIGSGVIQDLCKYVSFKTDIPYIDVATAPSMDGYASNGAAMILNGMKETVAAGLPHAIVADTEVLKAAPIEMIKAGYGDIIGKYSALNDWKLSSCVNGEYFCDYIYDITYDQIKQTLNLAGGLLERNEQSVKALMEALVVIGIMMSFATSSRPASGSEHHLSHFFEITGIVDGTPYFPHGIDVAFSTIITARLREKILKNKFPKEIFREKTEKYLYDMQRIYKSVADGCVKLQERVGNYKNNRAAVYLEKEAEIRKILSEMPSASQIEKMLSLVSLDIDEFYKLYDKQKLKDAIYYAKDLKDRYTVLWVYYDFYGGEAECLII